MLIKDIDILFTEIVTPKKTRAYSKYWKSITPKTITDKYMRIVFSMLSIQSPYELTVDAYTVLRDSTIWMRGRWECARTLKATGIGLYNNRADWIITLLRQVQADPTFLDRKRHEVWNVYLNRVMRIKGLGRAKASFGLEMLYPISSPFICIDTHICQLLGLSNQTKTETVYQNAENMWRIVAANHEIAPGIARHMYWDHIHHEQKDTRYWSHVFEKAPIFTI